MILHGAMQLIIKIKKNIRETIEEKILKITNVELVRGKNI